MNEERINTSPQVLHFVLNRNENFPNNTLPVLIYKNALNLPLQKDEAAETAQHIFTKNDWGNTWRNGIYDFHHYHSNTHECLAVVKGNVQVILGGPDGEKVDLKAGDVIIIPAGVGHKCVSGSEDFLCVGGYPQGKDYDICRGKVSKFEDVLKRIIEVPLPDTDPVFGKEGFIKTYWK